MKSKAGIFLALLAFVALAMAARPAHGQAVYGTILGTVTDPQGAAVVGAKVTVTSTTKGTSDETTTNESGNYTVTHLIPDTYRIKVEATGFKSFDIAGVQVFADTAQHGDVTLTVGDVTQTIEVTGELPQLKTDRADVAKQPVVVF